MNYNAADNYDAGLKDIALEMQLQENMYLLIHIGLFTQAVKEVKHQDALLTSSIVLSPCRTTRKPEIPFALNHVSILLNNIKFFFEDTLSPCSSEHELANWGGSRWKVVVSETACKVENPHISSLSSAVRATGS